MTPRLQWACGTHRGPARRIGWAAVTLLVASACTGGEPESETGSTPVASTTSTVPAMAGSSSTTAILTTTITTVSPWTTLPDPGEPPTAILAIEFGGPTEIETVCLSVAVKGLIPGKEEVESQLTNTLRFLGIGVVVESCQASLLLSVTGTRQSGLYTAGTCWPSETGIGETTLLIEEAEPSVWTTVHPGQLPAQLIRCPSQHDPIADSTWIGELVAVPLNE